MIFRFEAKASQMENMSNEILNMEIIEPIEEIIFQAKKVSG